MAQFEGFTDARYQQHDAAIREVVLDFNQNKSDQCGSTAEQAEKIPDLDYDIVKAWIIQETGGSDTRSSEAWRLDPAQVNVPGDWNEYKSDLGLTEPKVRNEGDLKTNLKAAVILLCRKGFGKSGQPPKNRPEATFDGWATALQRYNGRSDKCQTEGTYSQKYSSTIMARAGTPESKTAIQLGCK